MTKLISSLGLALTLAVVSVSGLAGCQLYFGDDRDRGRNGDGDGNPDGWSCESDADCAAGCYCAGAEPNKPGVCEEAGFCSTDADCPAGYTCDDRSSCVPDPTPTCELDQDCAAGSSCEDGLCQPTCVCSTDAEAQAAGWGYCDEARSTCEPPLPSGSCAGEVTCNVNPPSCPAGSVPVIHEGCYTGVCNAIGTCDVAPTCSAYQHEADCFGADGCSASYTGINCRKSDGTACQAGDTGCVCESFVFARCQ